MKKGVVHRSGIDTDARWLGYSHTKGWIFGYNLHLTSSTTATTAGKEIIVPLTAEDVTTTANGPDNKMYIPLTSSSSSPVFSLPLTVYMVVDPGYDAEKLYEYSKSIGNRSGLSSVEQYESNSKKRLELVCFYESEMGQSIYNRRRISIEPLIEHIKSVFRIDQLPVSGFQAVSAIVLLSVLLYQLMVYYNYKKDKFDLKSIKYMLGTW
jgi:DDE family transposase